MTSNSVKELLSKNLVLQEVIVNGWVKTFRSNRFIALNDGSTLANIQCVVDFEKLDEAVLKQVSTGAALRITGTLVESQGKGQSVEIQVSDIFVHGGADPETYPIQPKKHSLEFLREKAHLRIRTNTFAAIMRVRSALSFAIHQYFTENGFYYFHSPIITGSDAEGAGEMFRVTTLDGKKPPLNDDGTINFKEDFFGKETNLTVSGQLEAEAYAMALGKVYTFGPTFRAENSNTSRHLAEFWMVEPEIAFADLSDNATLAEELVKYLFNAVLEERGEDMAFFNERIEKGTIARLETIVRSEFVRMEYTEAIRVLESAKQKFEFPVSWGIDLQSEHERYLTEKYVGKPTIVMNYPKDIKAFYMRLNDDAKTVAAMDVLAPGIGEIIGGSQREERLDVLDARMESSGIDKDAYAWYRDLRRYGSVPHAGFGLGFERTVAYVTGLSNVRDVIPFPRTPGSARY